MINDMIVSDYFDKGVDFSGTDFTKNDYQLWVSKHFEKNEEKQGFKAWVGQLVHKASYDFPEIDVIKEFSFKFLFDLEYTVGGSIDRLVRLDNGQWQVEDIKTQGNFPATKSFKETDEKWIIQESIYRYAMEKYYGFDVSYTGIIQQYVMGYQKNSKLPEYKEYNKIEIDLMSSEEVEKLMSEKIRIATNEIAPLFNCQSWQCDYCSYSQSCPSSKLKNKGDGSARY